MSALHCYRTIYRFMAKNYKQVEDTIVLGWKVASANFDIWRMKISLINGSAEKLVV